MGIHTYVFPRWEYSIPVYSQCIPVYSRVFPKFSGLYRLGGIHNTLGIMGPETRTKSLDDTVHDMLIVPGTGTVHLLEN